MASAALPAVSGTMLWFNEDRDVGALRTDDGERIEVSGAAFADGERPVGRCAGTPIRFSEADGKVTGILFVSEPERRRARRRSR